MQSDMVVERLLVGKLPPATGVVADEPGFEVGRTNVRVQVSCLEVGSVTAVVGASVGIELIFIAVLN